MRGRLSFCRISLASLVIFVLMFSTKCKIKIQTVVKQYYRNSIIAGPTIRQDPYMTSVLITGIHRLNTEHGHVSTVLKTSSWSRQPFSWTSDCWVPILFVSWHASIIVDNSTRYALSLVYRSCTYIHRFPLRIRPGYELCIHVVVATHVGYSLAVLAEISLRSPRKLFVLKNKTRIGRIKVPQKLKKLHFDKTSLVG